MKFLTNKDWEQFKVLGQKQDLLDQKIKDFEIEKSKKLLELESIKNEQNRTFQAEKKELELDRKRLDQEFTLKQKEVVAAYEDKLSKQITDLTRKHMAEMEKLRTQLTEKNQASLEKMMTENYEKLSSSMTKLHEEGNATTKHMSEMTKEVIRAAGLANGAVRTEKIQVEHIKNGSK